MVKGIGEARDGNVNRAARITGVALLGVVLMLVVAVVLLLESSWMRAWLERQASQQLGREVEIVDHGIGWGTPITLQLEEVRIASAEWAEAEPLARMYELSITLNVLALLQGRLELDRIAIDQPVLHLIRREDGSSNWDELFDGGDPEQEREEDEPLWPGEFSIGQGHLVYRDAALDLQLDAVFQTPGAEITEGLSLEVWGDGRFREDELEYQGLVHYLREEDYLHVESMQGRVGSDLFSGALELDLDLAVLSLEARLDMLELDLERWVDEADIPFPGPVWERELAEVLAMLEEYEANLDIAVEELRYGDQALYELILQGWANEESVVIEQLQALQQLGDDASPRKFVAEGRVGLHEERPVADVAVQFERFDLSAALAPLGLGELGIIDGRVNALLREGALLLEDTFLDYRAPAWGLALELRAEARAVEHADRAAVRLAGSGSYEGRPVEYDLTVGPVDLAEESPNYPLIGRVSTGDTLLQMDGRLVRPFELEAIEGHARLEGPTPEEFAAFFGAELPTLPPYWLEAFLRYSDNVLTLDDAQGRIDELDLTGDLAVDFGRDVTHIETRIYADELDLNRWELLDQTAADDSAWNDLGPGQDWDRDLAESLKGLDGYDARFDLAFDRLIHDDQVLHDVALEGSVEGPRLIVTHFHALQEEARGQQGRLSLEGWAEERDQRLAAEVSAQLDQLNLDVALAPLGLGEVGILSGRLNLTVAEGGLRFENTALDYLAPQWDLALSLRADSVEGGDTPGVHLVGDGTYDQTPFGYDLIVGPLLGLAVDETPYPVSGELNTGDTRLHLNGSVVRPFELESLEGDARLAGPTPAELNELIDIGLPDLPPYEVAGYLRYSSDLLNLEGMEGRIGDSDVAGDVRLHLGERNQVWATLTSERVDVDELLGIEPENGPEAEATSEQEPWIEDVEGHRRVFPDREWNLEALRATDVVLDYRAEAIHSRYAPLNDLSLDLELEQGVMTVLPLRVGLGGGQVYVAWVLDAHQAEIVGELQLEITQVNLAALLDEAGLPDVAEDTLGLIGGHGDFSFRGRSMAELMAGLDGELELAMSQGWMDIIAAELMPLNVANALVLALAGEEEQVQLECSYAHFRADDGLVTLENFFMATEIAHFVGAGAMSLATEEVDMAFEGHNRDVTLFTANTPVKLEGPLSNLEVEVVTPELLTRGVLSALGALVAPPLAVLPWIDPGGGEDVGMGCAEALARYHD
ncbi:AsmA family protein [Halomonas sp. ANAO-440]|uniref:AsmA family protein n=1 Tax=Halomonas sp. ANAO-440 TaxID=2861360 RepID=UPI0021CD519D|nr:AsmA family protein [Halomonas sp. ANAO-440]